MKTYYLISIQFSFLIQKNVYYKISKYTYTQILCFFIYLYKFNYSVVKCKCSKRI